MFVILCGTVVKCWSQLEANHPTVVSLKPTRNISNFTNSGKKCDM